MTTRDILIGRRALLAAAGSPIATRLDDPCIRQAWRTLPPTPALPTPSRTHTVPTRGGNLFVADYDANAPHSVVFLHGGLASSNYWGHQIEALRGRVRVIAIDTRGHGRSAWSGAPFTYDGLAQDVADVLDRLEIPTTTIVGWSDGAIAGLLLASAAPARVGKLLSFGANSSLAGLNPGGAQTPVFRQFARRCQAEHGALSPIPSRFSEIKTSLDKMWASSPDLSASRLRQVSARTSVVGAEYDELIRRAEVETIARAIPAAELQMLSCVSHFAFLQDPKAMSDAIERL